MTCIKDLLEIVYYFAFIVLTYLIVKYAKKTYKFQISKSSKLLCKITALPTSASKYTFNFNLEIYNLGNDVAKNIKVFIDDNQITTINFIKPNESVFYPIGVVHQMIEQNRAWLNVNGKELKEDDLLCIDLKSDNDTESFEANIDILFALRTNELTTLDDVVTAIEGVTKAVEHKNSLVSRR